MGVPQTGQLATPGGRRVPQFEQCIISPPLVLEQIVVHDVFIVQGYLLHNTLNMKS